MKPPEEVMHDAAEKCIQSMDETSLARGVFWSDRKRLIEALIEALDAACYVIVRNEPPPGWDDWAWRDLLIQMTCFPPNTKKPDNPKADRLLLSAATWAEPTARRRRVTPLCVSGNVLRAGRESSTGV